MKIVIARAHLLPALAFAARVADRKNTIPILNNVLLDSDGENLRIVGTNLDQEISATVPVVSGEAVASTVPAVPLHDAIKTLPESAEITIALDKAFATISSGKSRFRLPVLPASDFHAITDGGWTHHFTFDAAVLRGLIDATSFAVEKIGKGGRIYLQGVFLTASGGRLVAVGTDGRRLARRFAALPDGAAGMPGVILPIAAIGLIESICADKRDVAVAVSPTKVRLTTSGAGLLTKLVDGTFPDWERIVPSGNTRRFTVRRTAIDAAIARVTAISTIRGSGVKFGFGTAGSVSLSTSGDERSADDEIECSAEADDDVAIGISGAYAREALAACEGDDVCFALLDNASPVVIEPIGNADQLFVIMPMRI